MNSATNGVGKNDTLHISKGVLFENGLGKKIIL